MRLMFQRTNLYQVMPTFYGDLLSFSNSCLLVEPDKMDVLRFTSIPIGEWYVANDYRMQVKTFMRELSLTVRQVVEKFCVKDSDGNWNLENVSLSVAVLFKEGNTEEFVRIIHMVKPNDAYNSEKIGHRGKKYLSIYYEYSILNNRPYGDYGGVTAGGTFLRISGYDFFPILVGRWGLTSGDAYGSWGPTDVAIGDIKELQFFARKQAVATDREVDPPLKGSTRLKKKGRLPKGSEILWFSDPKHADSLSSIYDIRHNIEHTRELREYIKQSINESYYVDMFRRFTQTNRQYMTAKQVVEEQQEKLIELAPTLELLNSDVLNPLVDIGFYMMDKRGMIPDPPPELEGENLTVEYVSILHQAQKLLDAGSLERFTGYVGSVANHVPEVLDKVNPDRLVDLYGDVASVPPGVIVSDEEAAQKRQARAEAEQRAQQLEDAAIQSEIAKNLGQAKMEGDSALDAVVEAAAG